MRIKLELTLKSPGGKITKDIAICPRCIDSDEPSDGLNRLYEDLLHYTEPGDELHIVAERMYKDAE